MAKVFDGIDEHQREWMARQSLFFVGGNWSTPFISPISRGVSGQ